MEQKHKPVFWIIHYESPGSVEAGDLVCDCELRGDGPMPAVPRVGDTVIGNWIPNFVEGDSPGAATVTKVMHFAIPAEERNGPALFVTVFIEVQRDYRHPGS